MYSSKTFNTKKVATEIQEEKTWPPKVTFRNRKTGEVERQDPYILRTVGSSDPKNRSRVNYMEYPAGSGNLWDQSWKPIGRWDKDAPEGMRFKKDEPHVIWTMPETEDQKLARQMAQDRMRIAELEKELAAIKSEATDSKVSAKKKDAGV
jgi:hypothetical protein